MNKLECPIAMVSLGCAKNLVNSEQMLWQLANAGYPLVEDPENARLVIINTCGFIESAKTESIETILMYGDRLLIVAGCLAQRYHQEIGEELPEAQGLVGCGSFHRIVEAVESILAGERPVFLDGLADGPLEVPRVLTTPVYSAYLKIAEGCDNRCSYCVIPFLRGPYRSRELDEIVAEAEEMVQAGVREIILVAQDTSRYGLDLYKRLRLPELLTRLCRIDGLVWIRLHYLYPDEITDELIDVIAREEKIVKYLDIPIQHIDDKILSDMNRRGSENELRALFARLRAVIQGVVLRTSLIVGFPGETEEAFEKLCDFVRRQRLERAGVFTYSCEEGTPAAGLLGQIPEELKEKRAEILRQIAADSMLSYHESLMGCRVPVLCEGFDPAIKMYYGRTGADSPEVDGKLFFTSEREVREGELPEVTVTGILDGDLLGQLN